MAKVLNHPLTPLITFAVFLSIVFVGYLFEDSDVSLLFQTLSSFVWAVLFVYWILADTRRRHAPSCFDFGFLCVIFFPLSVPWHCFRSRGWRGAITFVVLCAIWMAPYTIAMITWSVLYGD